MPGIVLRAAITLAILASSGTAAAAPGWIGGRLLFTQKGEPLPLDQVESAAGAEIGLEMRSGRNVIVARIDRDGYFVAQGEPGTYRVEYLLLGDRAEFFAPHELVLQAGTLTCAGTIAIEASPIESLGSNVETPVTIRDQCKQAWPALRELAAPAPGNAPRTVRLARPGPLEEHPWGRTVRDLLVGLRAEVVFGSRAALRGVYLLPFNRITIMAEGGLVYDSVRDGFAAYDMGGGAGYRLLGPIDGFAIGGVRFPRIEGGVQPVLGGTLRLTTSILGFGFRAEVLPETAAFFTIDIAPLGILGILL
jgi:hypothetical protein